MLLNEAQQFFFIGLMFLTRKTLIKHLTNVI